MGHSKGIIDRLLDGAERDRIADREHREYNVLRTRVLAAASHTDIATVAARVTAFVQADDPNPVYADALVNLLMEQGYRIIMAVTTEEGSDTYALMATRLVTRNIQATLMAYRSMGI